MRTRCAWLDGRIRISNNFAVFGVGIVHQAQTIHGHPGVLPLQQLGLSPGRWSELLVDPNLFHDGIGSVT